MKIARTVLNGRRIRVTLTSTQLKNYLKKSFLSLRKKAASRSKSNNSSWIKKWSIFYALLKVSKKKIKQNLISFKPNFFYIAFLPILGYALDQKNIVSLVHGPGYSEAGGGFLNKTLPGVNNFSSINSSKLSWETFNYTNFFKKIKWNTVNKINYFDGSIFISFNANSKLYNKQYYIGLFNKSSQLNNSSTLTLESKINSNNIQILGLTDTSTNKKLNKNNNLISYLGQQQNNTLSKKYFLSGRYYNQLCKTHYSEPTNLKRNTLKCFKILSYWQNFFSELDHIPTKLNNIYFLPFEKSAKEKATLIQKPVINKKFNVWKKKEKLLLNNATPDHSTNLSLQLNLDVKNDEHPFYLDPFRKKEPEKQLAHLQSEPINLENLCQPVPVSSTEKFSIINGPGVSNYCDNKIKKLFVCKKVASRKHLLKNKVIS